MKLVPTDWYEKFLSKQNTNETKEEQLKSEKQQILTEKDIPDDVKTQLYQTLARQFYESQLQEDKKPLLVKNVESNEPTTTSPSVQNVPPTTDLQKKYIISMVGSKRTEQILDSINEHGISYNGNNNVVVNFKEIPHSNIIDILKCLTNAAMSRHSITGWNEIAAVLKTSTIQHTLFPPGVRRVLFPPTTSTTPNKTPSRKRNLFNWETLP